MTYTFTREQRGQRLVSHGYTMARCEGTQLDGAVTT